MFFRPGPRDTTFTQNLTSAEMYFHLFEQILSREIGEIPSREAEHALTLAKFVRSKR